MARMPKDHNMTAQHVRSASNAVAHKSKKAKRAAKLNELHSTSEEKDWKHATCSICLERPHHAVLLLCSSHNKGCRPYMCGTNRKHSNCLELFKNAYSEEKPTCEVSNTVASANKKPKAMVLACPICRGQVKGWTVVEPARRFLNRKRRACIHDDCSFVGTYKKLRRHVKSKHPSSKPREVDPARLAEWKEFESEKERQDAISIVSALNPGSIIMGDYIIEPNSGSSSDSYSDSSYLDDSSDSDMSVDGDDSGFYHTAFVQRDRVQRRNMERPSQNLTAVGDAGIRCSVSTSSRRPLRVGIVFRSRSQPSGRTRSRRDN
ncbi:hypothetical protein ACP4OV_031853 [Aristida adscensionis]